MDKNNQNTETLDMVNRKSYPAVLLDVVTEHDPIRKVYVVKFIYKVYFSATQTKEVVDNFYLWDRSKYRRVALERLHKVLDVYNLKLLYKDYRNETSIANACKWLVDTKVEIQQYSYKGNRYKVLSSERNDSRRIDCLWECMLKNDLDSFPECLKSTDEHTDEHTDELLNEFVSACLKSEESNKNLNEDFCITPEMYYELEFNTKKKRR